MGHPLPAHIWKLKLDIMIICQRSKFIPCSGANIASQQNNGLSYLIYIAATTADALFAECWGHSAKPAKHSAKALPSAALGKGLSAKILSAKISLPSAKNRHSAKPLPSADTRQS